MTNTKKMNLILTLVYFGDAFVSPFLALYFISLGFENWRLSILLAIKPLASLIGNFFYGLFSKDIKRDVRVLQIILSISIISTIGFAFVQSFILCVIFMTIWSLHNSVFFSYTDGIAQKCTHNDNKKYSLTRIYGSFGYLICLLIGGGLGIANALNYTIIFLVSSLATLVAVIVLFFIKPFDIISSDNKPSRKVLNKEFLGKNFILFLLFYFFVIGIWNISDDYCSQFFNSLGLNDGEWSFLYAGQVVVEIISICVLEKIIKRRKSYLNVLILSASIMCVRTFLFAIPMPDIALIILTATLRGLGWGTFIVGYMQVFRMIVGDHLVTKGVTILAVSTAIFQAIGNYVYLYIVEALGYHMLYAILGGLQVVGLVLFFFIDFSFIRKENVSNNESSSIQ